MPELVPPTTAVRRSFAAAVVEDDGDAARWLFLPVPGVALEDDWRSPAGFARYVVRLREQSREEAPRPEGWVPATALWWVDGTRFLGRISIRHRLTPFLREIGGHIGYAVRPSRRREGHATAMLAAALPVAHRLGIDPALVTCDLDNLASRRVIEANGGVLEDEHEGKRRYWVGTGAN